MLNKVTLIGNIGSDPEIKVFDNGSVANFRVATNESYKDKAGNRVQQTEWHQIRVSIPGLVDLIQKYFKKGDPIYLEGKIRTREYEKDGQKRYITEIYADTVKFLPKSGGSGAGENSNSNSSQISNESSSNHLPNESFISEIKSVDDDLPF